MIRVRSKNPLIEIWIRSTRIDKTHHISMKAIRWFKVPKKEEEKSLRERTQPLSKEFRVMIR